MLQYITECEIIILCHSNVANSMARKLPIQKCMGKIAVQLKSHGGK